jgi:predicted transcriptional regulator
MKIQNLTALEKEMRAVARGERRAPRNAARPSVNSASVLLRLLTPGNRSLMKAIRDRKPRSVAELARFTRRAEPNLLRTLSKLEAAGLLAFKTVERRKVPVVLVGRLRLDIDPYAMTDRVSVL